MSGTGSRCATGGLTFAGWSTAFSLLASLSAACRFPGSGKHATVRTRGEYRKIGGSRGWRRFRFQVWRSNWDRHATPRSQSGRTSSTISQRILRYPRCGRSAAVHRAATRVPGASPARRSRPRIIERWFEVYVHLHRQTLTLLVCSNVFSLRLWTRCEYPRCKRFINNFRHHSRSCSVFLGHAVTVLPLPVPKPADVRLRSMPACSTCVILKPAGLAGCAQTTRQNTTNDICHRSADLRNFAAPSTSLTTIFAQNCSMRISSRRLSRGVCIIGTFII